MNLDVAKRRYKDVFRSDVINSSRGDFLATHVPMKTLYVTDHSEVTTQDRKSSLNEEEVYERFFSESDDDQFVLVKGSSGAGKSHLIRWFYTVLELRKAENEVVLPIRRADNTLKGTIRQLIEMPEVKNMPNTALYKKLSSASTTMPEMELKNTIFFTFVNLIECDDGKAGEDQERMLSRVDRQHLIALMQNSLFKERIMDEGGPVERIYSKLAENKSGDSNDKAAEFVANDFAIDSEFYNSLISTGADDKARKIANKLVDNDEFTKKIVDYVNLFVEKVIQRCAGLEPGDLGLVVQEIRSELYKQGRRLTVLIEDITAASGVDDSLLDALLTDKAGYKDKNLCRINAIVGTTDGYYVDRFRINTKGRIKNFINVPDDMFANDTKGLIEFFARYLNTASLTEADINKWLDSKGSEESYPAHEVTIGKGWGECKVGNAVINLFPFTENAIKFLYRAQDINARHPRALMREILEPYLESAISDIKNFPNKRITLEGVNQELRNTIYNRNDLDDDTKLRLTQFMYIWGDGTNNTFARKNEKFIGAIPESIFYQLGLPILDGQIVAPPKEHEEGENGQSGTDHLGEAQTEIPVVEENKQVNIALNEVDKWIEDKNYKLNIGQTTANVRALNDARKNINAYLFSVIDWVSEGVPIDAVVRVRDTSSKFLVAFERQTMKSDAVIYLPASIESRKIIEAFVRWSEVGSKSWDFPGSADFLYRVQRWTEKIKPEIIKSILHFGDKEVNYFSYATAAEYYRLIFNGYCAKYQNPQNFSVEMLLQKNEPSTVANGHSKNWNDLMKKMNGPDGTEARNVVLQYFNLPQGTAVNSTNYEFDYVSFNKAVRKVINNGLVFSDSDLQLDDPVRKRKLLSEHLKFILDRIDNVINEEKKLLNDKVTVLSKLIDLDEIDDEKDITDVIDLVKKFYSEAQNNHVGVAMHYDQALIKSCTKNASAIVSALKNAAQIENTSSVQELLLRFSKDPVYLLTDFVSLLTKTDADVQKANAEISNRMNSGNGADDDSVDEKYLTEKHQLQSCREMIEEVKNNAD